jgi:hypothetical protein
MYAVVLPMFSCTSLNKVRGKVLDKFLGFGRILVENVWSRVTSWLIWLR